VNCGPAYDTDGRADDAAAHSDKAYAIGVDELLGREPEGPTIVEQCRSATGSRRAWRSRSPSAVRLWRWARWSCGSPSRPDPWTRGNWAPTSGHNGAPIENTSGPT
jgi:hypothetical protein